MFIFADILAPKERNTASYFSINSSSSKFFPNSELYFTSIPKLKILLIVLFNTSSLNLKLGIPWAKIPPNSEYFS